MKKSIKTKILNYLTEKRDWIYGGQIEDYIRQTDGHKASNASRRCRELEDEGEIQRRIIKKDGLNVVQYRIKPDVKEWFKPTCCSSFQIYKVHSRDCEKVKVKTLL